MYKEGLVELTPCGGLRKIDITSVTTNPARFYSGAVDPDARLAFVLIEGQGILSTHLDAAGRLSKVQRLVPSKHAMTMPFCPQFGRMVATGEPGA